MAPISDDFLLGSDILDEFNLTVNIRRGVLKDGKWVKCEPAEEPNQVCKLRLVEETVILAKHSLYHLIWKGMIKRISS